MNEIKLSPVLELLRLTWHGIHINKAMWSWARLNRCMQDALHLAIKAGLVFGLDDFDFISKNFRWGYWAGNGEGYYCHAVSENNISAIKAYEHYRNRKPFIVNNVDQRWLGSFTPRKRGRLTIGSTCVWLGERITVTSFDDKNKNIIACSYKPQKCDERGYICEPLKVAHIYKLTHKDFKNSKGKENGRGNNPDSL